MGVNLLIQIYIWKHCWQSFVFNCKRPGLMFATSILSKFMQNLTKIHMGTAKRVLRYIQGSSGIKYEMGKTTILIGFCDSNWRGSEDDCKSTSGYAFTFGLGAFSWTSAKQQSFSLSTTEAKYVSTSEATSQAIWRDSYSRILLNCILMPHLSCVTTPKNPVFHQKTKHIKRIYYFIRETLQENIIKLHYCKTEEQIANIFIKPLPKDIFAYLKQFLGWQPKPI